MKDDTDAVELYRRYRPRTFKEVIGQDDTMRSLFDMVKRNVLPHAILMSGPSGVGKTTAARILVSKLNCKGSDFIELNCAESRGIDTIRDIQQRTHLAPMGGKCRVWILDEFAKTTSDAQTAMLKVLEDVPPHVYFFLCTTDPHKLLKTIITRCTEIKLKPLPVNLLMSLVQSIAEKEKTKLSEEVIQRIADNAEGSARKALVILGQVIGITDEEEQLNAIQSTNTKAAAYEIAQALFRNAKWPEVAKLLKEIDDEPESLRWMILGYANTTILSGGKKMARAYEVIRAFEGNFFDSKRSGLIAACFDLCG